MTEPIPTTEPTPEIKLDGVFENFYEHFNKPGNSRILFTAPFGMGKTYFLNRFFNDYMHEKDPNVQWIRVSPVNYVPSDNVTIFELIKVEILLNLFLCGELDSEKIDLKSTYFESSLEFVKRKPGALVNLIADMLPLLSIDPATNLVLSGVKDATKSVTGFLGEIKKLKVEKDQELLSEDTTAKDYIEHLINQKGTHLEFDLISEIIFKTIEKSEKKFVLVVDDLDRLDPAHIFRILNIFSAHNNFDETNKFGFDKVITVCDLENIKSIFYHFYGKDTKFNGYIDKFVTYHPYRFENFGNVFSFICANNKIAELQEFNLVLAVFVYNLIKKGKTDLRKVFSALYYKVSIGHDIYYNLRDNFYCVLNEQPIFFFSHFLRQLMPFENYSLFEHPNSEKYFEIKIIKENSIENYENLEKQTFALIGTFWIQINTKFLNGTEYFSIECESRDGKYTFEYDLDNMKKNEKQIVSNIKFKIRDKNKSISSPDFDQFNAETVSGSLLKSLYHKSITLIGKNYI